MDPLSMFMQEESNNKSIEKSPSSPSSNSNVVINTYQPTYPRSNSIEKLSTPFSNSLTPTVRPTSLSYNPNTSYVPAEGDVYVADKAKPSLSSSIISYGMSMAGSIAGSYTNSHGDTNRLSGSRKSSDADRITVEGRLISDDRDSNNFLDNTESYISPTIDDFPFLTGELKVMSLNDAYAQIGPGRLVPGVLFMTNYRVAFLPSPAHLTTLASTNPSIYSWLNVPLACISTMEKEKKPKESRSTGITILIACKDARQHRITIQNKAATGDYESEKAFQVMSAYAFPNNIRYLFAFSHSFPSTLINLKRVEQYDPVVEFSRLGILDGDTSWRMSSANFDYKLCDTYPQLLIMPKAISDEELFIISNFRSGHRLPVLCWGDKDTGATMWRSSQPKAGVSGSCMQDEKFLDVVSRSNSIKSNPLGIKKVVAEPILNIIDCRPRASAMANRAAGAGYELQTNYPNSRLEFYNIDNIHTMRESHKSLINLILSPTSTNFDANYSKQIEDTQWLSHVRLVIKASHDGASFLRKGQPVLVHCSHGWDRTAQVCALSQLFLDPFYRTYDGFKILIEKEWCSYGHPFQLRCAHGQDKATRHDDQCSPIFLQFLECVWQVLKQFPHYFEFNARYLLAIADHIFSGRFSTFLFSCDCDREKFGSKSSCIDIWSYLHYNKHSLTNPLYMDPNGEDTPTTHILLPPLSQILRNVSIWSDYYFRWATLPSIGTTPEPLSKYLHDNGICSSSITVPSYLKISHTDINLPPYVTSDDIWEGAFRRECLDKEKLKELNSTLHEKIKETEIDKIDSLRMKEMEIELRKQKLTIERLAFKLVDKGLEEDEVSNIILDAQAEIDVIVKNEEPEENNLINLNIIDSFASDIEQSKNIAVVSEEDEEENSDYKHLIEQFKSQQSSVSDSEIRESLDNSGFI